MVAAAIFPVRNGALFLWLFSVRKCNNQGNLTWNHAHQTIAGEIQPSQIRHQGNLTWNRARQSIAGEIQHRSSMKKDN
jgi:hypothetical protein